jgi:hypothetical protein
MAQAANKRVNFDWIGATDVEVKRGNLFFKVEAWDIGDGEREDRELVQVFLDPEVREKLIRELLAYDYEELPDTSVYIRDKLVVNMLPRDHLVYVN